jgi:hypothetical protein
MHWWRMLAVGIAYLAGQLCERAWPGDDWSWPSFFVGGLVLAIALSILDITE